MITIRLLRIGKKKQPAYRIVLTKKSNPPISGRFIDEIGFYNPLTKEKSIKKDKVKYWISKGASLSDTVHNLLVADGVIEAKKKPKHSLSKKKAEELKVSAAKNQIIENEKSKVLAQELEKKVDVEV